jgi:hypothetical protein
VIDWLRPHPHRGDVIAAGAVPLSVAAFVIDLRMTQWSVAARFVVVGAITALLLALGWLAQLERDAPRAYHSVLLVVGLLPLVLVFVLLAELIGAHHPPGAGGEVWTFGLASVVAAVAVGLRDARRRHAVQLINAAGLLTLLVAFTYLEQTFIAQLVRSSGAALTVFGGGVVGWPLFLLIIGGVGLAIGLRPRQPLPPVPSGDAGPAPTVPLRSVDPE